MISVLSSQFSVLSSQFSVLSSQFSDGMPGSSPEVLVFLKIILVSLSLLTSWMGDLLLLRTENWQLRTIIPN